jgi:hypothetical protein
MATLTDLVSILAERTHIPRATVFAYGRFAREAGFISQRGRGRSAAIMNAADAANLLIGVCGTSIIREVGDAIRLFRPMKGTVEFFDHTTEPVIRTWLSKFGPWDDDKDDLAADLGTFIEWLISDFKDAHSFLGEIPVLHVPPEQREKLAEHYSTIEDAFKNGLVAESPATVGLDVQLRLMFDRSTPHATVEIMRQWDSWETLFEATFVPKKQPYKYASELTVSATITEQIIFFLDGSCVRRGTRPGDLAMAAEIVQIPYRRGLSRKQAAIYVGVSPSLFDEMVRDGRMPPPKRINARTVWDVRQIDAAFDALPSDEYEDRDPFESVTL